MGLQASPHDPCLYSGVIHPSTATYLPLRPFSPTSVLDSPSAAATAASLPPSLSRKPIHVGLYIDDFVFYSEDEAEEKLFKQLLARKIKVDFMDAVDYFLGTAFT
jgi:hypothetical protein